MSCNLSTSLYALLWYRQGDDGSLVSLVTLQKGGDEKSKDKITAKLDKKMQQSSLQIQASQPSHSGITSVEGKHSGLQSATGCLQTCSWVTAALTQPSWGRTSDWRVQLSHPIGEAWAWCNGRLCLQHYKDFPPVTLHYKYTNGPNFNNLNICTNPLPPSSEEHTALLLFAFLTNRKKVWALPHVWEHVKTISWHLLDRRVIIGSMFFQQSHHKYRNNQTDRKADEQWPIQP